MKLPRFRRIAPLVILIALVVTALVYLFQVSRAEESQLLQATGTVEAIEVVVAPERAGKVTEVLVDEGDRIEPGDVLFRLDDEILQAQRQRAVKAIDTAMAQLALVRAGATPEDIAAAEAAVVAAQGSVAAAETALKQAEINASNARTVEQAESSVAAAEANLAQAEATAERTRSDLARARADLSRIQSGARPEEIARLQALLDQAQANYLFFENIHLDQFIDKDIGGAPEERARFQMDSARGARDAALAQLDLALAGASPEEIAAAAAMVSAAQAQVVMAEAGVQAAEAALAQSQANPETTQAQVALADSGVAAAEVQVEIAKGQLSQAEAHRDRLRAGSTVEEIAVLEAQVDQAQAELSLIDTQLAQLVVRAAVPGVILSRSIQPGEVVQPGSVAFTIGQLDDLTITVYIKEDRYGQINLGDRAQVTVDSFPRRQFDAVVIRIADRAEFTPSNVQTEEGRRNTVFAVKLTVDDPEGSLKPGIPADVVFPEVHD
jgi:HlyD family secretion protein